MSLRISGKNLDIGETLRTQINDRVTEILSKYSCGHASGHVTVERDGTGFRTDAVLHLSSGSTVEVEGQAHDAYASCNQALDRLETRLRRHKRWLKDRPSGGEPEIRDVASRAQRSPA